jgi:hypothetical protein
MRLSSRRGKSSADEARSAAAASVGDTPIVRFREGFRMPALRDRWAGAEAGVRKPPKNEPAGSGEWLPSMGILWGSGFGEA